MFEEQQDLIASGKLGRIPKILLGIAAEIMKTGVIYMPSKTTGFGDAFSEIPNCSHIRLRTQDGYPIMGVVCLQQSPKESATVVFFHENAGDLEGRANYLKEYYLRVGCNIIAIAYRGYSCSQGVPDKHGLELDALATLKYVFTNLSSKINLERVTLHGKSLGAAVAAYAAAHIDYKSKIRGVILDGTFSSMKAIGTEFFPLLEPIKDFVFQSEEWDTVERAKEFVAKTLLIGAKEDEICKYHHTEKILKSLQESGKEYTHLCIEKGDHNSYIDISEENQELYFSNISNFVNF